jgi:AcrR family transcriptional regulator
VTPRRYQGAKRAAAAEQTRQRIISAAHALLVSGDVARFTVEAVARRADVARQTVYDQFGGRVGLLEAVFDVLASRNDLPQVRFAITDPEPWQGLDRFVAVFARFWNAERSALRRIRGYAAVDVELGQVVRARDERRRQAAAAMLARLIERLGYTDERQRAEATDAVFCLTSFETLDCLASGGRSFDDVLHLIIRLCRTAVQPPAAEAPPALPAAGEPAQEAG